MTRLEAVEGEIGWTRDDAMLYAIAVGAGQNDPLELDFTTEGTLDQPQRVVPSFSSLLSQRIGRPSIADYDRKSMLHVGEVFEVHDDIAVEGRAHGEARVVGVFSAGRNAIAMVETQLRDSVRGTPIATTTSSLFVPGGSGVDGARPSDGEWDVSGQPPDYTTTYRIACNQALLYRLCDAASRAGFSTPPLHGLCTQGFVARALIDMSLAKEHVRFSSLRMRFTSPVFPGDDLEINVWDFGDEMLVQARTEHGVVVDRGRYRATRMADQ